MFSNSTTTSIALASEDLERLSNLLKVHPNWTVYIIENCSQMECFDEGVFSIDHYQGYKSVDFKISQLQKQLAERSNEHGGGDGGSVGW